ncbi:hypothetical protein LH464_24335 [Neorhizobium sp. T786]|uniref:hypothetical protein n=1 Tax=Pseudorhizobium xiangyangii TaxID=2883104 RepID=UPI001CFFED05|nr:hypothetical protein [Neorhizobium xiangyangii]MCB5205564.1 hypothetical protein [Neorhizobium xiangyangii]
MTIKNEIQTEDLLLKMINEALAVLDERGDIVLCSSTPSGPARYIYEVLHEQLALGEFSTRELMGLRSLVLHAVDDKRFFDWEMPTLTGLTAEEFVRVSEKLPKG